MKKYLRVYRQFIRTSFSLLMVYRANFINHFINGLTWAVFLFVSVFFLTRNITSIAGWNREELFLLAAMYNLIIGFYYVVFSSGLHDLSEIIFLGKLDTYLLKPIDSQFHISLNQVNLPGIPRSFLGIFVVLYIAVQLHVHLTLISFSLFLISTCFAFLFLYSTWFLVLTLLIWSPRLDNLIELLYTVAGLGRYPKEVLKPLSGSAFIFLAIPFFLTISIPTRQLLGKATNFETLTFCIASILLFLLSRIFWKFALRFYSGGSV